MSTLIPTASACYSLQLPPTEKDDRLNLNVRTGSASTLYNSLIFVHGGLTIGLELLNYTIPELNEIFYNRINISASKYKTVEKYLSGELFYLSLIERNWSRVVLEESEIRPKPRLLHQICAFNNCLYLFGGLALLQENDEDPTLVPCNDLWEFDLELKKWTLLDDGSNYELDDAVPSPRFNHKLTVISSLSFANRKDHFGLFIAGGKDKQSNEIYDNSIFDLVEKRYVGSQPFRLVATTGDDTKDKETGLNEFVSNPEHFLNVDQTRNAILSITDDADTPNRKQNKNPSNHHESIVVYGPTRQTGDCQNSLVSFKVGKREIKGGKVLRLHKNSRVAKLKQLIIPYNLRYPTAGLFGQNVVLTGFLPDEYEISIFVYNRPTGKWSRLNIFCSHEYGSHRFWGGFAWQSHHKVILIGNSMTSRTTSSVRFFSIMLTVSLPITNILVSSELSKGRSNNRTSSFVSHGEQRHHRNKSQNDSLLKAELSLESTTEDLTDSSSDKTAESVLDAPVPLANLRRQSFSSLGSDKSPTAVSFSDYVHYAAPKTTYTTIRSVFPPEAITLGRNAFNRIGDLIADIELVSCNGDRIPVSSAVLMERWGQHFILLLAKGYINAVDKFETDQALGLDENQRLRSKSSNSESSSSDIPKLKLSLSESLLSSSSDEHDKKEKMGLSSAHKPQKDVPQFRLPFQDSSESVNREEGSDCSKDRKMGGSSVSTAIDPHHVMPRKNSTSSFQSNSSSLLTSHLQDIPPQLPLPDEQIPAVPAAPVSYRSASRKNSQDHSSPRSSLIHTLTVLRNIPVSKSPRESPFSSPRPSMSGPSGGSADLFSSPFPSLKANYGKPPSNLRKKSYDMNDGTIESSLDSFSSGKSSMAKVCSVPGENPDSDESSIGFQEFNKNPISMFDNALLNFDNIDSENFRMEPSLIPRKLYIPFMTLTVKAFCEYLYTGQIGNKWLLAPTLMDNLLISKFYRVPLLYDLISEILFGVIGKKEAYIIGEARKLKARYFKLLRGANIPIDSNYEFPMDEYDGFLDTVDDGYLDITLLKKASKIHADSVAMSLKKKSVTSNNLRNASIRKEGSTTAESVLEEGEKQEEIVSKDDEDESRTGSTSEEDEVDKEYGLVYLEAKDKSLPTIGPRSKSIFDRQGLAAIEKLEEEQNDHQVHLIVEGEDHENLITLDELVASDAPSDYAIDLIFETATLVTDMKMLLRTSNLKAMTAKFRKCKADIEKEMADIEYQLTQMPSGSRNLAMKSANQLKELQLQLKLSPIIPTVSTVTPSPLPSISGVPSPRLPQQQLPEAQLPKLTKSTSSLSRIASHTSFKALRSMTDVTPMEKLTSDKSFRGKLQQTMLSRTPTNRNEDQDSSSASSIKSSSKKRGIFGLLTGLKR